jgi:DNA-binding Lrp family transcriptional regulator
VTLQTERLLDPIGWRILEALQADARLSFSQLGRRVGLSAPAAAERVRRMEDAGIIAGYRVDLALEKLFPVTAIIRISAPEENCTRLAACARGRGGGRSLPGHRERPTGLEGRCAIRRSSGRDHSSTQPVRNAYRVDRAVDQTARGQPYPRPW